MPSDDAYSLFRLASEQKRSGDLAKAIETLRLAERKAARESLSRSVKEFLRLPIYLQEAGRWHEAWAEFERLLTQGFPGRSEAESIQILESSLVYDKMRLALQREGRAIEAVRYGLLSDLTWKYGLALQGRYGELEPSLTRENLESRIRPLLKSANRMDVLEPVTDAFEAEVRWPGKIHPERAADRIMAALTR